MAFELGKGCMDSIDTRTASLLWLRMELEQRFDELALVLWLGMAHQPRIPRLIFADVCMVLACYRCCSLDL